MNNEALIQKLEGLPEQVTSPCVAEADIKNLLAELRKIKAEKDIACGSLIIQLAEIQEELRRAGLPFDWKSEKIEASIKDMLPAVGHTIKTEYGSANFRKGSVRVSYDYKALDACPDEYVKQAILPYRKETLVSSSISIEVF